MPAPYEGHADISRAAGRQVMELIARNIRPRDICTRDAFENAARIVAATGGSTHGGLHLPAMAHEAGIELTLFDVAEIFQTTPYVAYLTRSEERRVGQGGVSKGKSRGSRDHLKKKKS